MFRCFGAVALGFLVAPDAFALDILVDDTADGSCNVEVDTTCRTDTLNTAIGWANSVSDEGDAPVITLVNAAYAPGTDDAGDATEPRLDNQPNRPMVIQSDTTAAATNFVLPPICAHDSLTLRGLVIKGGYVTGECGTNTQNEWGGFVGPVSIWGDTKFDRFLEGEDLVLEPGILPPETPLLRGSIDGVWATEAHVDLANFTASGFLDGAGVQIQDDNDTVVHIDHSFALTDCEISGNGRDQRNSEVRVPSQIASAVIAIGTGPGLISNCTFQDNRNDGSVVAADTPDLIVEDCTFGTELGGTEDRGNYGPAIWLPLQRDQRLTVRNTTFIDQDDTWCSGGICADVFKKETPGASMASLDMSDCHFERNHGDIAADIAFGSILSSLRPWDTRVSPGDIEAEIEIVNTDFVDSNVWPDDRGQDDPEIASVGINGHARLVDVSWSSTTGPVVLDEYSTATHASWGTLAAMGELELIRGSFTDTSSYWAGGAIVLLDARRAAYGYQDGRGGSQPVRSWAFISDTTFDGTTTDWGAGGAIYLDRYTSARIENSSFTDTRAWYGGAIAAGWGGLQKFELEEPFGAGPPDDEIHLDVIGSTFTNTTGWMGGAILVGDSNNVVRIIDSSFTGTRAEDAYGPLYDYEQDDGGVGGVIAMHAGNHLELTNTTVHDSTAVQWGGMLFSWFLDQHDGFGMPITPKEYTCMSPQDYARHRFTTPPAAYGSTVVMDGVAVTGSKAKFAAVATFGWEDEVTIEGSTFTDNIAGSEYLFYGDNVSTADVSCNTLCGNTYGSSGLMRWYDDGMDYTPVGRGDIYGETPVVDDIRYNLHNNVLHSNDGAATTSSVFFDICEGGIWPWDYDAQSETTVQSPRGYIDVTNNTFLQSNPTNKTTFVQGTTKDVRIEVRNNIVVGADAAVNLKNSPFLFGSYNLYDQVAAIARGDATAVFPDELTDIVSETPLFWTDTAPSCDALLALVPATEETDSPGWDDGDPTLSDWDDGVSDMGAYGGPDACIPDMDDDGYNLYEDCVDEDATVHPDAVDIPYDGTDQDCVGGDLCDVDGDGFPIPNCDESHSGPTDCNDADSSLNPGAEDVPYDGIDQDCTGLDNCDDDGDGYPVADCIDGYAGPVDCDDDDGDRSPGIAEIPDNGIDENCDGADLCDVDGDGVPMAACDERWVGATDCNDADPDISPTTAEVAYDGIDQDCDSDDLCDVDGDGVDATHENCGGTDCNDTDNSVHPGATDTAYDGIDQDCDGHDLCDVDGDGYRSDLEICGGADCNDSDAAVHPGAEDIVANGIDDDCSGGDNCDADGDGYLVADCDPDDTGLPDCDDSEATTHPDAYEIPDDGVDQDCSGEDATLWAQNGCNCSQGGGGPLSLGLVGLIGLALTRRRTFNRAG